MATIGGAKALGRDRSCGTIEVGKCADIILIRTDRPHMTPLNDPFSAVVFSAKSTDVETVLCDGELLMEGRRLLTIDMGQVIEDMRGRWDHIQNLARLKGIR